MIPEQPRRLSHSCRKLALTGINYIYPKIYKFSWHFICKNNLLAQMEERKAHNLEVG
jgi:hypothetical protein